ncbi:GNAT family N-acetyltransferase, partial [Streptomyces sp. NPDC006544]|uniref:GNAT family N-acetyltransferase n=1 Tax=Streptomyces sp. NPDC006544 TaxID=3154583 RepID=UPI0033A8DDF7
MRRVRELLDAAFEGDFGAEDFEHALGGMHALVYDGEELVAHGSVVQRRVVHAGRALRTGYVEAVAVRADRRRSGLGGVVMRSLEGVVARAYVLGALSAPSPCPHSSPPGSRPTTRPPSTPDCSNTTPGCG